MVDGGNALACDLPRAYYPDQDGDGFGSVAAAPVMACTPPANHVANRLDCADGDSQAAPGQSQFFSTAVQGSAAVPFDFNCDGSQEPEVDYPAQVCNNRGNNVCDITFSEPVWLGTAAPDCGESRQLLRGCFLVGDALNFECRPTTGDTVTQKCR